MFQWLRYYFCPRPRTLQERYPAKPGAFVTSYSSIDLTDDAFADAPRPITWPWDKTGRCILCGGLGEHTRDCPRNR